VVRAVKRFGKTFPVYLDNDHAFWRGLDNHYWPAFYLVDRQGRIRYRAVGEMHRGTSRAQRFEEAIVEVLGERRG